MAPWAAERRVDSDLAALKLAAHRSGSAAYPASDDIVMNASTSFRDALRAAAHNSVLA